MHKVLFAPSKNLWQICGLILNTVLPLVLSCWGLSFVLGCRVSFYSGIQHSSISGCSTASCDLDIAGEDECMSYYSAILEVI